MNKEWYTPQLCTEQDAVRDIGLQFEETLWLPFLETGQIFPVNQSDVNFPMFSDCLKITSNTGAISAEQLTQFIVQSAVQSPATFTQTPIWPTKSTVAQLAPIVTDVNYSGFHAIALIQYSLHAQAD